MPARPTLKADAEPRVRPEPEANTPLDPIRAIPEEMALHTTPEGHFGGLCTACGRGLGVYSSQEEIEQIAADHAYYDHGAPAVPPAPKKALRK